MVVCSTHACKIDWGLPVERWALQSRCDVRARMGGAGWARGEARVADDSDFETLKTLLAKEDGWNVEYEKDGVKVWSEDAAHGALRTVKVCFHRFNLFEKCLLNFLWHFFLYRFCQAL